MDVHKDRDANIFMELNFDSMSLSIFTDTRRNSATTNTPASSSGTSTSYTFLFGYKSGDGFYGNKLTLCDIKTSYVDVRVRCSRGSATGELACASERMRHSPNLPVVSDESALDYGGDGFRLALARELPSLLPATHPQTLTTLERYLQDPPTAFDNYFDLTYSELDVNVFQSRLALLFNTFWRMSLNQSIIIGNDGVNANRSGLSAWGQTEGTWSQPTQKYYRVESVWISFYFTATTIMMLSALCSIILKRHTRASDFIGSISALTRDTPFIDIPSAGSFLDGTDRIELLKDKWVKIQDVKPDSDVGRIALSDTQNFFSSELKPGRRYE